MQGPQQALAYVGWKHVTSNMSHFHVVPREQEVLGAPQGFFVQLVDAVVDNFGGFYPELVAKRQHIADIIRRAARVLFYSLTSQANGHVGASLPCHSRSQDCIPSGSSIPGDETQVFLFGCQGLWCLRGDMG